MDILIWSYQNNFRIDTKVPKEGSETSWRVELSDVSEWGCYSIYIGQYVEVELIDI